MTKVGLYILLFIFQLIFIWIGVHWQFFINHIYWPLFNFYQVTIGTLTNSIPFSIGDIVYFILGLYIGKLIIRFIYALYKWKKQLIRRNTLNILRFLNIFLFIYMWAWGFTYYFHDLEKEFSTEEISIEDYKSLAKIYLQDCDSLRTQLKENTQGFVELNIKDKYLSKEICQQYSNIPNSLKKLKKAHKTRIKKSLYSPLLVYLGIGGYFNPFTQECQYISILPDFEKPNTVAHEIAHKLGYSKENEANFAAYLLGRNSDDKNLEYSVKMSALRHTLYYIYPKDSIFSKNIRMNFSNGMKRDMKEDSLMRIKYQSQSSDYFYSINNQFLKMNNQEGTISYLQYIEMVAAYEKENLK